MFSQSVFNPMSPQAQAISNLSIFIMIAAGFVLLGLVGTLAITLPRFRHRRGQGDPPQTFGRLDMEIVWTAAPILLLTFIFGVSVYTMRLSEPGGDPSGKVPVSSLVIIARQWWWEVRYPSGVVTANIVHIPLHTRLLVSMKSADVVHSWWVPQLEGKIDSVPGQTNHLWLEADKAGTYEGACVEFCGNGHAWMRTEVIAEPMAQFKAWERHELQPPRLPTTPLQQQGARVFAQLTCQSCHTIADIGPNLNHFASRPYFGGGVLANTPANVAAWLHNPDLIKPGVHMPNLDLTDAEVNALTAYLESLK